MASATLAGSANADADATVAIAHHHDGVEAEATPAADDLRYALDTHHAIFESLALAVSIQKAGLSSPATIKLHG